MGCLVSPGQPSLYGLPLRDFSDLSTQSADNVCEKIASACWYKTMITKMQSISMNISRLILLVLFISWALPFTSALPLSVSRQIRAMEAYGSPQQTSRDPVPLPQLEFELEACGIECAHVVDKRDPERSRPLVSGSISNGVPLAAA
ncbi:unnamed protein product [Somion occarium]|uniref:Uncharacterized protein n=1 Tax=Somion occarium TaxID=3059160 RepID=A0ABP1DUX0_9APHY